MLSPSTQPHWQIIVNPAPSDVDSTEVIGDSLVISRHGFSFVIPFTDAGTFEAALGAFGELTEYLDYHERLSQIPIEVLLRSGKRWKGTTPDLIALLRRADLERLKREIESTSADDPEAQKLIDAANSLINSPNFS